MCYPEWAEATVESQARAERSERSEQQHFADLATLRRVRDRIDREFAKPLNVEELARGAHMSSGHLSRQFRAAYGESPYSYLMTRRIERSIALLRRGDLLVTEVCFEVGCASLGTFTTRFTELVGMSPGVFRRVSVEAVGGSRSAINSHSDIDSHSDVDSDIDSGEAWGGSTSLEGLPACIAKQLARPLRQHS